MRAMMMAFLLCFALVGAPSVAQAQGANSLNGVWHGVFAGGGNPATEFELNLSDFGGRLTGDTTERNSAGGSFFLLANVTGTHQGDQVRFTKTYDGTGGRSNSVEYVGRVQPGGRRIVGTWSIGRVTGQFELVR